MTQALIAYSPPGALVLWQPPVMPRVPPKRAYAKPDLPAEPGLSPPTMGLILGGILLTLTFVASWTLQTKPGGVDAPMPVADESILPTAVARPLVSLAIQTPLESLPSGPLSGPLQAIARVPAPCYVPSTLKSHRRMPVWADFKIIGLSANRVLLSGHDGRIAVVSIGEWFDGARLLRTDVEHGLVITSTGTRRL